MGGKIEEVFTEDGKELSELVQEWINENKSYITCKSNNTNLQSTTIDR